MGGDPFSRKTINFFDPLIPFAIFRKIMYHTSIIREEIAKEDDLMTDYKERFAGDSEQFEQAAKAFFGGEMSKQDY